MGDEPPKKVGSLRDRIAAFEQQSSSKPAHAPPPTRPKPGGISWKPKQPSPPSSPARNETKAVENDGDTSRGTAMSAADAKESIGQGGSLKERMAALQGRGAFGDGAPSPPAPKPSSDKPKWKPPPQPVRSPSLERDQPNLEHTIAPPAEEGGETTDKVEDGEGGEEETKEEDPEEEERQRRAAIAARLQRLGGAKIGMAPPVFGSKPAWKKPAAPKAEEETPSEHHTILRFSTMLIILSYIASGLREGRRTQILARIRYFILCTCL